MQYLWQTKIEGDAKDVEKIKKLFRNICFGGNGLQLPTDYTLKIVKILPNTYRAKSDDPVAKKSFLYVVIPNKNIENVWPGNARANEIRIGTATAYLEGCKDWINLTQAVALHKGKTTLYLCLTDGGKFITKTGCLGI